MLTDILANWNFWFSIITAIVAIVALFQTKQQIKMGNKQHLFDQRMEYYLIVKGLIQLYKNNKDYLIIKDEIEVVAVADYFQLMTNNTYLEKVTAVISHPKEMPYHKEFLIKLETIKDISTKIKLLFNGKAAVLLGNFVFFYQELLFSMYQYQILFNHMEESAKKFQWDLEEAKKNMNEPEQRQKLCKAMNNLKQAYEMLIKENVEKKITKQIRIK